MIRQQIDSLTSLRGIAAWWVVVFHFRDYIWAPGSYWSHLAGYGYLAVDLFFIMSGFVIQLRYGSSFERVSVTNFRDFIVMRLARIYPLHLFMCVIYLVNPVVISLFSHRADPGGRYDPTQYVLGLFLVQAWGFLPDYGWNVPSWSISAEFAAYLAFPFLCVFLAMARKRFWQPFVVVLAAAALLAVCLAWAGKASLGAAIYDLGIVRCIAEFTMGMAVCQLSAMIVSTDVPLARRGALVVGATAFAAFAAGMYWGCSDYLYVPLCFAGLVFALSLRHGALVRALECRALLGLGVVSYSTYLCHFFVKDWVLFTMVGGPRASTPAVLAYLSLTLGASFLLYRFVELPGQRLVKDIWSRYRLVRGEAPHNR